MYLPLKLERCAKKRGEVCCTTNIRYLLVRYAVETFRMKGKCEGELEGMVSSSTCLSSPKEIQSSLRQSHMSFDAVFVVGLSIANTLEMPVAWLDPQPYMWCIVQVSQASLLQWYIYNTSLTPCRSIYPHNLGEARGCSSPHHWVYG